MRCSLFLLLFVFACDETAVPTRGTVEPSTREASELTLSETPETPETNNEGAPQPPSVERADTTAPEDGDGDSEDEVEPRDTPLALHETLIAAPTPNVRVEVERRINRASILRLTSALGLPAPLHVHGRPVAVPESEQVISLVSFLDPGESDAGDERLTEMSVDQMHTEAWLLERNDGALFRVAAARVPYQPVPSYNDIAVGAENIGDALAIKAQNIEDFDGDGALEYQLVVELIDEVVCGVGPLTRRYLMIFNLPTMSTALNIRTMESAVGDTYFRSTILWGDQNDDGHPDVDLRVRSCNEWSAEERGCVRHGDAHVMYVWQSESDRWDHSSATPGAAPCDGEE